jgi:6-phosphofructokinase 2
MPTIVTLTLNPAIDESSTVENVMPEHKLRCTQPQFHPGGGGINVARAIHKLGGEATAFYMAGGAPGQMLRTMLADEGVSYSECMIEGWTRTSFTVLETSSGLQYRFSKPGPDVTAAEQAQFLTMLRRWQPKPDYIVASGSLPPGMPVDFYARVAEIARELEARLVVDTSGPALRAALEAGVYLVKPNARELSTLLDTPPDTELAVERIAADIVQSGRSEVVLVSLGAAGAVVATRAGSERIPAPVVPIISKVGAGDSMVGGVVLALARGEPLHNAVRFGVAAGTAAVITPGTMLCRREDTERLYQSIVRGASG